MIDRFDGTYRFLSNFYVLPKPITHDGIIYPTTEHAFVAAKTLDFKKRFEISKIPATEAGKAKRVGRTLVLRPEWEKAKTRIMYELVLLKFVLNQDLRWKLLDTYPSRLVEGNTWGDTYWGVCQGVGQNKLGSILEIVRQQLLR
ncbi:hypothetical protein LCGC14_2466550 [marine sediment metagenome]|uniref:NADAR domain-containing protein n=1 Tax=marine sediment metagenome TaxID=412755 RepID=A0A0F9E5M3_9ZZZZ